MGSGFPWCLVSVTLEGGYVFFGNRSWVFDGLLGLGLSWVQNDADLVEGGGESFGN